MIYENSKNLDALKKLKVASDNNVEEALSQTNTQLPAQGSCIVLESDVMCDGCDCLVQIMSNGISSGIPPFRAKCHNGNLKQGDIVHFMKTNSGNYELIAGGTSTTTSTTGGQGWYYIWSEGRN